jgi:23S rRNA pseudouridine2605 synthase
MRLQKYLAESGVASRRASEDLIRAGRVTVDGAPAELGMTVDPSQNAVAVDGRTVEPESKVYVVLNKPKGVITTARDTHARETVLDLLDGVASRVFPVGRLDRDVTGTLLLTNDGELANRLIHPRYEIDKVYSAWVEGIVAPATLHKLAEGVILEDGPTSPATASIIKTNGSRTLLQLTVHEGRKHLVKRLCSAVGHPVRCLRRVSLGPLRVDQLRPGEWRYLTPEEVRELKETVAVD